jgi:hypothetical protein
LNGFGGMVDDEALMRTTQRMTAVGNVQRRKQNKQN